MQNQFSILSMIQQGWYATYPLLIISVVCVTIILERVWALWGVAASATQVAESAIAPLKQGKFDDALAQMNGGDHAGERVFHEIISEAQSADRARLGEVDEERRFAEMLRLRGSIWVLATSGASAPFIGLFGTVVGILVAFQSMAVMGTGGFSVVAAGISEALISTALGLVVAVPAVWLFNYFTGKVDGFIVEMDNSASELIDYFIKNRTKQLTP